MFCAFADIPYKYLNPSNLTLAGAAVSTDSLNVTVASTTNDGAYTVTVLIAVPLPLLTRTLLGAAVPVSLGRGAVFRTGADPVISTSP